MARSIITEGAVDIDEPLSAINVTSLVDVMFCLLIMFMIATPLMSPKAPEVQLPAARANQIAEEELLLSVITVDAKGNVFLGTLPLASDVDTMTEQITKNAKLKEDGMAFIQGDQAVAFDRIVDVMVALRQAEIPRVGFVTDPNRRRLEEAGRK